jgi:hypothetical protein
MHKCPLDHGIRLVLGPGGQEERVNAVKWRSWHHLAHFLFLYLCDVTSSCSLPFTNSFFREHSYFLRCQLLGGEQVLPRKTWCPLIAGHSPQVIWEEPSEPVFGIPTLSDCFHFHIVTPICKNVR